VDTDARVLSAEVAMLNTCHVVRERYGFRSLYWFVECRLCRHGCPLEGIQPQEREVRPRSARPIGTAVNRVGLWAQRNLPPAIVGIRGLDYASDQRISSGQLETRHAARRSARVGWEGWQAFSNRPRSKRGFVARSAEQKSAITVARVGSSMESSRITSAMN